MAKKVTSTPTANATPSPARETKRGRDFIDLATKGKRTMWKEKYGNGWRRQKDLLFEREEVETVSQLLAKLADVQGRGF